MNKKLNATYKSKDINFHSYIKLNSIFILNLMKRKTLIVDIDGVILNFAGAFAQWWNKNEYDTCSLPENPHDWQFDHPNSELIHQGIDDFVATDEYFPLMEPDLPQLFKKLHKKYRIHLMTSFSIRHRDFRIRNLKHHGIVYDEITFANVQKIELVRQIQPVALIEDKPKNIMDFVEHGYPVYVPYYWNYCQHLQHDLIKFYNNWKELVDMIDH